jgi:ABC-type amino acid transport substrate-binding protein
MKLKYLLLATTICVVCFFSFPQVVAQNPSPSINNTNSDSIIRDFKQGQRAELRFGFRQASYPVSYTDPVTKTTAGFCNEFANELLKELNRQLQKNLTLKKIDVGNFPEGRYDGLRQRLIDIECGANTIDNIQDIEFSKSFFATGVKLITQNANFSKISTSRNLENITVGVYQGSTTEPLLRKIYPRIEIKKYPSRYQAIESLKQGHEIQAYAGDSIILRGIKEKHEFKDYILFPRGRFITEGKTEEYGLAVLSNNPNFLRIVNLAIDRNNVKSAIQKLEDYDNQNEIYFFVIISDFLQNPFTFAILGLIIGIFITAFIMMSPDKRNTVIKGVSQKLSSLFDLVITMIRKLFNLP